MIKTIAKIDGMACGMCESHICDVIRKTFPDAKKVSASHKKKQAEFVTDAEVNESALKKAIEETGYYYLGSTSEEYKKKGLFGLF